MGDGMTRSCDNCKFTSCYSTNRRRYGVCTSHQFPEEVKTSFVGMALKSEPLITIGNEGKFSLDKLIDDHWGYVELTLEAHNTPPLQIRMAKHHYVTAAKHFWKHCVEHYGIKE